MADINIEMDFKDSLVLIAEDEALCRQLLTTFLDIEGIKHISCNNGLAAISLAKERKPDLILLDVMMPHMDGFTACKKLKDCLETTDIPVIFISSKAEKVDKIDGFNAGGVDYITKPFEKIEVMVRIKTQLKLKKAMDKLSEYNRWLEKMMNDHLIMENDLKLPI